MTTDTQQIQQILTAKVLEDINRPVGTAYALPNACYNSQAFLDAERQFVYGKHWAFAAVASQLKNRGDAVPVTVAGQPILLVRNKDGQINAFHNVCRHRGMQLVDKPCSGNRAIMCPYHSWTYSLDGDLKKTPHFGGHDCDDTECFEKKDYGLIPVRSETWNDLIFVNLSGDAEPLSDFMGPLNERWKDYDFSQLRHGGSVTFDANCNWKLAIENFIESYHLPWTHPSLNSYSKMEEHFNMLEPTYMGQGSLAYNIEQAGLTGLPVFPNLTERELKLAEYPFLMPNTMLGIHPNHFFVFSLEPVSPGHTIETFHFYFVGDEALAPELAEQRQKVMAAWAGINREDITMIEGMQRGRQSDGYEKGRFSPYHEVTTHEFEKRVANMIADGVSEKADDQRVIRVVANR